MNKIHDINAKNIPFLSRIDQRNIKYNMSYFYYFGIFFHGIMFQFATRFLFRDS